MRITLFALAFIVSSAPAFASDNGAVMAPVNQFFNGLNTNNLKLSAAACATPASVIDDFPPHEWQGQTACGDWAKGFAAAVKEADYTENHVTLGKPLHLNVTGDRAYLVVPATYTFKDHGKPTSEPAIFTAALRKLSQGWRITGWAWAQR